MKNAIKQAIIAAAREELSVCAGDACSWEFSSDFTISEMASKIADTAAEAVMEIVRTFDDIEGRTPTLEIPPAMLADLLCPQCAELEAAGSDGLCRPCAEGVTP